jgi:hypothetical protein
MFAGALQAGAPVWLQDPTAFRSVVIEHTGGACSVLASAALRWRITPFRPTITASDAGSVAGATGRVHTFAGRPRSYTVAADDGPAGIVKRFGLTRTELLYLNPFVLSDDGSWTLTAGTVVNLDPARRGEDG